jgi:small subunit ribosomal protein S6
LNHYEVATLLTPDLTEKDIQVYIEEMRSLLQQHGAVDIDEPKTGRRTLAYPVRKHTEGQYVFIQFDSPATLPEVIRTELKHREGILRLAFIRRPKPAPEQEKPTETVAPAEAAPAETATPTETAPPATIETPASEPEPAVAETAPAEPEEPTPAAEAPASSESTDIPTEPDAEKPEEPTDG